MGPSIHRRGAPAKTKPTARSQAGSPGWCRRTEPSSSGWPDMKGCRVRTRSTPSRKPSVPSSLCRRLGHCRTPPTTRATCSWPSPATPPAIAGGSPPFHVPTSATTRCWARWPTRAPDAEQRLAATEEQTQLRSCVERLGDVQRAVVTLRLLDELDGDDVARALGITRSHVAVLLHRAKANLHACMTAGENR